MFFQSLCNHMTAALFFWKEMLPVLEGPRISPVKATILVEGKGVGVNMIYVVWDVACLRSLRVSF